MRFFGLTANFSMRRVRKNLSTILLGFLAIGLNACGGGAPPAAPGPDPIHVGSVPQLFLNELGDGTLRITLEVYGPDGALEYTQELQINEATGEIFSNQFELPTGFTYTFLISFLYSAPSLPELPVAFVAKIAATEGDVLAIFWEESELILANAQLSPDISASVSVVSLPDLDSDDDGYDNFSELREQSDPLDPNSVPAAPVLVDQEIVNSTDYIELVLEFSDASGVGGILPVGKYVCGFFEWTVEDVTPDGRTQRLTAKFNLHSYNNLGSDITLNVQVNDVLGISRTFEIFVDNLQKNPLPAGDFLDKPQIAIFAPQAGETVSDFINVQVQACDEDGIATISIPGVGSVQSSESFEGVLDTTTLGDGPQNITVTAADTKQNINSRSVQVLIANQNPIKIDYPQPGTILHDGITVVAHVDRRLMPDVATLFIESITNPNTGQEILDLNQMKFDVNSLPEAFTGQVFDTSLVDNMTFVIKFVAVSTDNERVEREVQYRINNRPQIETFDVIDRKGPLACLDGGGIHLEWEVLNADPNGVNVETVGGLPNISNRIFDCEEIVTLIAGRTSQNPATGQYELLTSREDLDLTVLNLIAPPLADEGILPTDFNFQFEMEGADVSGDLQWRIVFENQSPKFPGEVFVKNAQGAEIDGGDFSLGFLRPRMDYLVRLYLLNKDGDRTISKWDTEENSVPFTTSDVGLVGWWRMEGDPSVGRDWSGWGNDGTLGGDLEESVGCAFGSCADLSGSLDYITVAGAPNVNTELNPATNDAFTVEAWVKWDQSVGANQVILLKNYQYSLRTDKDGKLLFGIFDTANQFISVYYDDSPQAPAGCPGFLDPNKWYHLVGRYDGPETILELWVNGVNCTQEDKDLQVPNQINGNHGLLIFGTNYSFFENFEGFLDEVAIYDRFLSDTEIRDHCNQTEPDDVCL